MTTKRRQLRRAFANEWREIISEYGAIDKVCNDDPNTIIINRLADVALDFFGAVSPAPTPAGTQAAYQRSLQRTGADVSHFPEDIQPFIKAFVDLWNWDFYPKGRREAKYKAWIKQARSCSEACAEFGVDLIHDVHKDYEMQKDPYHVKDIGSIVSACAQMAARKRTEAKSAGQTDFNSLLVAE